MKATIQRNNNFPEKNVSIQLNTCAHNVGFSHVHPCNCIFVKLFRFPRKEIIQQIKKSETGEIIQVKAFIRICIRVQDTVLCLVVRYSVRTAGATQNQYVITEKEKVCSIQAEKQELIDFVRPYLPRLYDATSKQTADLLKSYFNEYVDPSTLASIAKRITPKEERKAAQILAAYFGF